VSNFAGPQNEKAARQRDGFFLRENRSDGRHRQNSSGLKSYEPKTGGVKGFLGNNPFVFSSLKKCFKNRKNVWFRYFESPEDP